MKPWLIAVIAAVVLIALGGFLISKYGHSENEAGATKATNAIVTKTAEKSDKQIQERNRIDEKVFYKTSISDIDRDGCKREWVRDCPAGN